MAVWSTLLMETPANTVAGTTGIITPLSLASGVSPSFSVDDIDTITLALPGGHYHAALITVGANDLMLVRDALPLQRYRVVAKTVSSSGGNTTVQVTASSYKEVVNNWLLHDSDKLDYPVLAGESADDVAWAILAEGQSRSVSRSIAMTRGLLPAAALPDHVAYVDDQGTSTFFTGGQSRMDAVNKILQVAGGCDWAIEPDPANPYTKLKFNVWNRGQRHSTALAGGLSPVLLSTGSMASYSVKQVPHTNVLRASGVADATGAAVVNWRPVSENPTAFVSAGAWESVVSTDQPNDDQVSKFADEQYALAVTPLEDWEVTLHPGEWRGPADFWIGDSCRMALQARTVDDAGMPTDFLLLDVDQVMRIVGLSIEVGSSGGEAVTLQLNRTRGTLLDEIYALRTDLNAQRRRT